VVCKALRKSADARHQRMEDFADALAAIPGLAVVRPKTVHRRDVVGTDALRPWAAALRDDGPVRVQVDDDPLPSRTKRRAALAIAGALVVAAGIGAGVPSLRLLAASTWERWFPSPQVTMPTPSARRDRR
jgi:hypothetical protein